jgi:hypothetical protein
MRSKRLEQYTIKKPEEVLLVKAIVGDREDEIIIFKGFSSSLMGQTDADPDIPVLPENGIITNIDRLKSPYHPNNPTYLEKDLTWEQMENLLFQMGI